MDITVPESIALIVGALAPVAVALVNGVTHFTGWAKRIVSVAVTAILTALILAMFYASEGVPLPAWPELLLLSVATAQLVYGVIAKGPLKAVEDRVRVRQITRAAKNDPRTDDEAILAGAAEGSQAGEPVSKLERFILEAPDAEDDGTDDDNDEDEEHALRREVAPFRGNHGAIE